MVEASKAARAANPGVKLLCNDYNLDVSANKRAAYVAMITEINNLGKENGWAEYGGRPLIDGIGVQAHFNSEDTGIETNTRTMLNAFQGLRNQFPGFEVVITELDATTTSYAHWQSIRIKNASGAVQGGDSSALTEEDLDSGNYHFFPENITDPADEISIDVIKARLAQAKSSEALLIQAKMYALAFKVYSEPAFSGLISRITIWGINDEASWRKESKPLFFEQKNIGGSSQIRAKPAFYAISDPAKYIRDHSGWN